MREIKFRAWEPNEKRFLSWGELQECTVQDVFQLFDCQQYTGLHDKNGKEIYEGDILRTDTEIIRIMDNTATGKRSIKLSVVEWNTDGWGYYHAKSIQNNACALGFKTKGLAVLASFSEVIGNIYENPELLEVAP